MGLIVAKDTVCCTTNAVVNFECVPVTSRQTIVPVGQTAPVDQISVAEYSSCKWHVVVTGATVNPTGFVTLTTHQGGASPSNNIYSILGDYSSLYQISTGIIGGILQLIITNTSSEDLLVSLIRMPVPSLDSMPPVIGDYVEVTSSHGYVLSSETINCDYVPITKATGIKWIVSAYNSTKQKSETIEVFALSANSQFVQCGRGNSNLVQLTVVLIPGRGMQLMVANTSMENLVVDCVRVPIQTSQPLESCGNSNGLSLWISGVVVVPSLLTVPVDVMSTLQTSSVKWQVTLVNPVTNQSTGLEVLGDLDTQELVVYGIVGPDPKCEFSLQKVLNTVTLYVNNLQTDALLVESIRLPIPI